jgi:hypothetical protein
LGPGVWNRGRDVSGWLPAITSAWLGVVFLIIICLVIVCRCTTARLCQKVIFSDLGLGMSDIWVVLLFHGVKPDLGSKHDAPRPS